MFTNKLNTKIFNDNNNLINDIYNCLGNLSQIFPTPYIEKIINKLNNNEFTIDSLFNLCNNIKQNLIGKDPREFSEYGLKSWLYNNINLARSSYVSGDIIEYNNILNSSEIIINENINISINIKEELLKQINIVRNEIKGEEINKDDKIKKSI